MQPVFRFAPSPNGELHLGHAYSAILNHRMARESGGRFLLRMEDIDVERCLPAFERRMMVDLEWLGLEWDGPVRRQSEHFESYRDIIDILVGEGLVYKAWMSRSAIRRFVDAYEEDSGTWPRDPDGVPMYPGGPGEDGDPDEPHVLRIDMRKAVEHVGTPLSWSETGCGPHGETGEVEADPAAWGDIIVARRDTPTSYNISVVADDALQGVTHVVRGHDLFHATAIHVLMQELLGFARPTYFHHELILAEDGRKLSKSNLDTSLRALREAGATPRDVHRMVGLDQI